MLTELAKPLPLNTPKGKALAHFVIDYGIETDLYWVCFLKENGECWTFNNRHIRIEENYTIDRNY